MAEHLLRSELQNGVSIESAGYPCKRTGINPRPATREAMKEIDLDVSAHRSKRVTPEMIDPSDNPSYDSETKDRSHRRLSQRQIKNSSD
jgi:protein-tyrosine-phosphatase